MNSWYRYQKVLGYSAAGSSAGRDSKLLVEDKTTGENKEYKYDPIVRRPRRYYASLSREAIKATLSYS